MSNGNNGRYYDDRDGSRKYGGQPAGGRGGYPDNRGDRDGRSYRAYSDDEFTVGGYDDSAPGRALARSGENGGKMAPADNGKKFVVHISEDDYGRESGYSHARRDTQRSRSAEQGLARREVPISRTRIVTSRSGEKYEIPEDQVLPSKLLRKSKKNQRSRGCLVSVVYAIIVCSISALLSFYLIVGINDMFGLVKEDMEIVVSVPDKADLDTVTKLLEENGVVDYPFFFKLYAQITNDSEFKHGEFTLNSKSDYDMIIRKLTRPSTADKSVVKVTIPEGLNLEQVADILEYNCVCEKEAFFNTVQTREFKHKFYKDIPGIRTFKTDENGKPVLNENGRQVEADGSTHRVYKLEGYLFPDTYSFYIWDGSVNAINTMLNAFDDKVYKNTELNLIERANALGYSVDQIITLASILERESGDPEAMKVIAGIFYNRMKKDVTGHKLQSDATCWYPYPTKKAMMESSDLTDAEKEAWYGRPDNYYSTYNVTGLPAGPICCPSYNAIYAACYPNNNDYVYFFTYESEGATKYYYTASYDDFNAKYAQLHG